VVGIRLSGQPGIGVPPAGQAAEAVRLWPFAVSRPSEPTAACRSAAAAGSSRVGTARRAARAGSSPCR